MVIVCIVVTKDEWITKNKDSKHLRNFALCVWRRDVPYNWGFILVPLSYETIDLNQLIDKAVAEKKINKLSVEKVPNERVMTLFSYTMKQKIRPSSVFLPVILHKENKELIASVSVSDLNLMWSGLTKDVGGVTTAIHHLDREKYLLQGFLLRDILVNGMNESEALIKHYTSRYPMAGFTLTIGNEAKKIVVDHLLGKSYITTTEKNVPPIWSFLKIFFKREFEYNEVMVRSNFSPVLGYWDLKWDPSKDNGTRKFKFVTRLARYLRAFELFSNQSLSLKKVLRFMSDHKFYPEIERELANVWKFVRASEEKKALEMLREVKEEMCEFSVCKHSPQKIDTRTVHNVTINLEKREFFYVYDNPCKHKLLVKYVI